MDPKQSEVSLLLDVGQFLDQKLIDEFTAQGHHLTGGWENSLHGTVSNSGFGTELTGEMAGYGVFLNRGVSAENVPFNEGSGAGTSKFITALTNYWMLRGLNKKQATQAAFATAKKQKREGMPTAASYAYSTTGERKTFIDIVAENSGPDIDRKVSDGLDEIIDALFLETGNETI